MNTQALEWMTRKQAAAHLTAMGFMVTPKILANLAWKKKGPPFRRVRQKLAIYNRKQLEAWAIANSEMVTPDKGGRAS